MADYTAIRFEDMEPTFNGMFRRARASLGVTSFGMQVLEMGPESGEFYPNHNHEHDSQEEVYVVIAGSADFDIEGDTVHAEPEMAIRVAPGTKRKIEPGPDGVKMIVLGAIPGAVYAAPAFTELGGPPPGPESSMPAATSA